jgi:DNA recombination protein RmuC
MDVLYLLLGFGIGGLSVWLFLKARYGSIERDLSFSRQEIQTERARTESAVAEIRMLADGKARAEQQAGRVPGLENELRELRENVRAAEVRATAIEKERESAQEKLHWVEVAEQKLREVFQALAAQSLQNNSGEFLKQLREQTGRLLTEVRGDWGTHKLELRNLMEPLGKTMQGLDEQVHQMELKREGAYHGLQEQLRQLGETHQQLQSAAVGLVQALRAPSVRGRWGELQLRRVVEMAGMVAHVDFEEQAATDMGRPDMIVHLPTEGILPVDSKTPMQAYLDALDDANVERREAKLKEHAQTIRARIRELSQKRYWEQFDRSPEFVVMFIPNDACLSAAFEKDADILEFSIQQRVLPTTPVTLLALLKTVAYGWQQQTVAENARKIAEQGKELYDRLARFVDHLQRTGNGLETAIRAYNDAIGSLESRLIPSARRFKEMGAATVDIQVPNTVDRRVRTVGQLEFVDITEDAGPEEKKE